MKKLLCMTLSLVLCLCLAACGTQTDDDKTKRDTIDEIAESGVIPELSVKLGTSPDEAVAVYDSMAAEQNNEDIKLYRTEGQLAVNLSNGQHSFYYEKAREVDGISVIAVTGGTAFGLELAHNTTQSDVEALLDTTLVATAATPEQLYFLPGTIDGGTVLSCKLGDVSLKFFFFDGFLSAVTLTNTVFWAE